MKNFIFLFVLAFSILLAGSQTTSAQEKRLGSAPPAFRAFFAKFKSAVEKSDKAAVARMTRFPFHYGFDAGDEGTMSQAQFVKRFNEIFGKSPKNFMTEKNPLFSRAEGGRNYVVSTEDAAHLIFIKNGSGFKFSAYLVEP